MSEVSAQQVKDLREKTGAGFMDCKNALTEADGDLAQRDHHSEQRRVARGREQYAAHGARAGVVEQLRVEAGGVASVEEPPVGELLQPGVDEGHAEERTQR